jgi:UDP-N-acetylglucosamine 2-epimerase (non-hydrolysing)
MKDKKNKIGIILGTRPEIIKMSPIIKRCIKEKIDFFVIHSNQHYSKNLDSIFFKELHLPKAKYNLGIKSNTHSEMTGNMMIEIEKILIKESPSFILVQGDTNTGLSGALASAKLNIPVGHIEAGLRSYDRKMPEEINRVIIDHISTYLFVPTKNAKDNLIKEGIDSKKIFNSGNTITESISESIKYSEEKSKILNNLKIKNKKYILTTIHRQENVDDKIKIENIIKSLNKIQTETSLPVILPAHPRLINMLRKFNITIGNNIKIIDPVGYLDFLTLQQNASLIITDSGGIQEESCILKTPCITIRDNTERPETVEVGANILVGTTPKKIIRSSIKILNDNNKKNWRNPFGNKQASKIIIKTITE